MVGRKVGLILKHVQAPAVGLSSSFCSHRHAYMGKEGRRYCWGAPGRVTKAEGNLHGANGGTMGTHRWFTKTNFLCHCDHVP